MPNSNNNNNELSMVDMAEAMASLRRTHGSATSFDDNSFWNTYKPRIRIKEKTFVDPIDGVMYPVNEGVYVKVDNVTIHKSNIEGNYYQCRIDKQYYPLADQHTVMYLEKYVWVEVPVPLEILNRHFFKCDDCGKYYPTGVRRKVHSHDYETTQMVCTVCYREHYFQCNSCGKHFRTEQFWAGNNRCHDCDYRDVTHPARWCNGVLPHDANVLHALGISGPPRKERYMGVELEHEYSAPNKGVYQETINSIYDFLGRSNVVIKHDGSLGRGAETVTKPMLMKDLLKTFDKFFVHMKGRFSKFGDRTGMHVHVNKRSMSELTIGKVLVFMNLAGNNDFMTAISGRDNREYAAYDFSKRIVDARRQNGNRNRQSRYAALNITDHTIEFRVFKSPKHFPEFAFRLEFVDALITFCEQSSIRELEYERFCIWLSKQRSHPFLTAFLKSQGYIE